VPIEKGLRDRVRPAAVQACPLCPESNSRIRLIASHLPGDRTAHFSVVAMA
jgi:hypothetical protein